MGVTDPDLHHERTLLKEGANVIAGIDEVGRGAWAGPVTVGVVSIVSDREPPKGTRDSKMVSPSNRKRLVPEIERWASGWGIGHASPRECDEHGMTRAIALAASRALDQLPTRPDAVIVDGPFDLLRIDDEGLGELVRGHRWRSHPPKRIEAVVKADQVCASVAAASILAKVARDALMVELSDSFPAFDFDRNVGYPSPSHQRALRGYGLTPLHRRSWSFTDSIPWQGPLAQSLSGASG
jgi:ribonuclease HII